MLSRINPNKDSTYGRRPFDDIANIECDDDEDEDMVRWNTRKNKAKANSRSKGEAADKENIVQPSTKSAIKAPEISKKVVGDKKRSFGDEIRQNDAEKPPHPSVAEEKKGGRINNPHADKATDENRIRGELIDKEFVALEGLLQSDPGRATLTPVNSTEKNSSRSSPATSAFLSPSGSSHTGTILSITSNRTPVCEEKFSTPPSVSSVCSLRSAKADYLADMTQRSDMAEVSPRSLKKSDVFECNYDHKVGEPSARDLQLHMEVERLFSKVRHNRMGAVENALKGGCDPHMTDENGNSLLHVCAQNNLAKMANLCIHYGCDINAFNKKGRTPLDYCDTYKFNAMGDWLVKMGAENGEYDIADHK